jgi:hypothetical protein
MTTRTRALPVFLALTLLAARCPAAAALRSTPPSISSAATAPAGLVAVIENKPQTEAFDLRSFHNPNISGIALQIHWSDIEPVEGKPDWSKLDALFADARSSNKWVQLLIFPGFFTPGWLLDQVKTQTFAIQYGPGQGTVQRLPMPWDTTYLDAWFAFLRSLSARYGKSPAFRIIAADGPTSVSAEFTLPASRQDIEEWQSLGFTTSKYVGAWQKVFQEYAADFPDQFISLSEGAGQVDIDDQGKITGGGQSQTRQAIVDQAIGILGSRFVLQSSNVHAGAGPHSPDSTADDAFVIGYSGRVITGLQMRTSAEKASSVMGADGDPPLALRRSIDLAMEPNVSGRHVDYLEIYEPDVLAPEMQPVLQYGASKFGLASPAPGAHPSTR